MSAFHTIMEFVVAGRPDLAEAHARSSLVEHPQDADVWRMLGSLLGLRGHLDEAVDALQTGLSYNPLDAPALLALGSALHRLGRFSEAFEHLEFALKLDPDNIRILTAVGHSAVALGQMSQAKHVYLKALAMDPSLRRVRLGLSNALFGLGEWLEGWAAFESRLALAAVMPAGLPDTARWRGGALPSSLVVFAEQGLGDTLQFIRFIPEIVKAGTDVTLIADPRLERLLSTLPRPYSFRSRNDAFRLSDGQMWAPLLSLAGALRRGPKGLCPVMPYLSAERALVTKWQDRLRGSSGHVSARKVGICWQCNPDSPTQLGRSVALSSFAALAGEDNVRLISLQKGFGLEQIDDVGFRVEVMGADFDSGDDAFVDTAAVMMSLDEIITIDTSVAHLAGALGVPVTVLLKQHDVDWRWLQGRNDTPWYPSMKLVRGMALTPS